MKHYIEAAVAALNGDVARIGRDRAVVGLDGFVDTIMRVVGSKSGDRVDYLADIPALAGRIAAAAGKSTALELHATRTKLGGNGPILANALAALGMPLRCLGALGTDADAPEVIHPVFRPMQERCELVSLAPVARTDALEFDDGKLMLQQMRCLDQISYDTLRRRLGDDGLQAMVEEARLVALTHWASLPHMSDIWRSLQRDIVPRISRAPRDLFIDLADPQKRSREDIREALALISGFRPAYRVTLGLNLKESQTIAAALDCEPADDDEAAATACRAAAIREAAKLDCVTIHPTRYAVAADAERVVHVDGPFIAKPTISTGAGDHFNAGFCFGRCLGQPLGVCLTMGVGTSGYYVRTAECPSADALARFLSGFAQNG